MNGIGEREALIRQVIAVDNRPRRVAEMVVAWWLDENLDVHASWPRAIAAAVDAIHSRAYYADDRRIIPRTEQDRVAREYRALCAKQGASASTHS